MIPVKLVSVKSGVTKKFATQVDAAEYLAGEVTKDGKKLKATSAVVSICNRISAKSNKPYWGFYVYPTE